VEVDEAGHPLDQSLFDQARRRALIPGLYCRIDGGRQRLRGERGDGDRAVEVGEIARVVVPDGVVQVEAADLVECQVQRPQRGVEVDCRRRVREQRRRRGGSRGRPVVEVPSDLGGRRGERAGVRAAAVTGQQGIVHV